MACDHRNVSGSVTIHCDAGPVTRYHAEVLVTCADCGVPFAFLDLPGGHSRHPRVSPDQRRATLPVAPDLMISNE